MPILKNPRHEKFALALSEGKSATEAYIVAGYKPCRQNAARLTTNDDIKHRLAELQTATANKAAITIQSICAELDEANLVAKERGQAAAMVSASTLRAKLAGLLRDRVEISNPDLFSECESPAEVAETLLREQGSLAPTQPQIEQVVTLFESLTAELEAVAKGRAPLTIDARSINGRHKREPRSITGPPWGGRD